MTNSEKQTKDIEDTSSGEPSSGDSSNVKALPEPVGQKRYGLLWILAITFLLMGWLGSLYINNWHFTPPVVMLWLGWFGVLLTTVFLWAAGLAVWTADPAVSTSFDISLSRSRELAEEKKALLRAIKEIEFDRDLGKMSDSDAKEIMRFYRARAIEVIKELDGLDDAELTVGERVERDIAARMTIAKKTTTRKAAPAAKTSQKTSKKPNKTSDKRIRKTKDEGAETA